MLPYRSVLSVACVVLAVIYVCDSEASAPGRLVITAITLASFMMPASPTGQVVSIAGQLGVALFGLLRWRVRSISR